MSNITATATSRTHIETKTLAVRAKPTCFLGLSTFHLRTQAVTGGEIFTAWGSGHQALGSEVLSFVFRETDKGLTRSFGIEMVV